MMLVISCGKPTPTKEQDASKVRIIPREKVRVGLLSKYRPRNILLRGAGRFFIEGRERGWRGELRIRIAPANTPRLGVRTRAESYRTDHLLVESESLQVEVIGTLRDETSVRRRYRGPLEFSIRSDGGDSAGANITVVHTLDLESYVRAVALRETGPTSELNTESRAALMRAMRAVVRGYALAHEDRHPEGDFRFCDLTHCMVFAAETNMQANATGAKREPLVLLNAAGNHFPTYFSSTCGGLLAGPDSQWPEERSPSGLYRVGRDRLPGHNEDLCAASPHYKWRTTIALRELTDLMNDVSERGALSAGSARAPAFRLKRRDGRVHILEDGKGGRARIAPFLSRAGRRLGWNAIKSNLFELQAGGGLVRIQGRGLGHGIGLCQWGARRQAALGRGAREILSFYFPGARIRSARYADPTRGLNPNRR